MMTLWIGNMLHEIDRKKTKQIKVNQEMYAVILKLIGNGAHSAHDVAKHAGCHLLTAQSLMNCFRKHKLIHVCGWIKDTKDRDSIPVYRWGENEDAPRTKLTASQRTARYKAKKAGGLGPIQKKNQSNRAMRLLMS